MAQSLEDSQDEYLYVAEYNWDNPHSTMEIDGFEVPVILPKKPPKKLFKNYGLPKKKQKFKRDEVPKNLKRWPERKLVKFVERMFHKRKHGEWWLIGGREVYIPGRFWFYLNVWWCEAGRYPEFREGDWHFFLVWEHCVRDRNCYGMLDIKGRRMGDTEKSLCVIYEKASGTRNTWCGMQNQIEDDAEDNFKRIVEAHKHIPFYFKPILPTSSDPKKVLEFRYPAEIFTKKKLEKAKNKPEGAQGDIVYKFSPINSRIDYETSVKGRYDGKRLAIYHLDEPGKQKNFNVNEQWAIIKPALALKNGKLIIGKTIWTTTVEDFENAQTMENVKKTWDESNPKQKNANGRTKTGMYRYFRNCVYAYACDEFGFHLRDECIEFIKNERASFEAVTDWDGLADFNRKHPITIDDVFRPPHNECVLFPVFLDKRVMQIETNTAGNGGDVMPNGASVKPLEIAGDFVWKDGFGGEVMWLPNPQGKWRVSHHPEKTNFFYKRGDSLPRPGNEHLYTFGVDPVDHLTEDGKGSDGAGAIFRRFNPLVDNRLDVDEHGDVIKTEVWKMQTDRFVADYLDRPDDPTELFEEILKGAIYFGVPIFPEKDRGSIIPWFIEKGFTHYVKYRPKQTRVENAGKKTEKWKKEKGIKASKPVINLYIQELKKHVFNRWQNYHHLRILNDYRKFNGANRTKRDLTVACGMALLAAMDSKIKKYEEKKSEWNGMPTRKRKHTF